VRDGGSALASNGLVSIVDDKGESFDRAFAGCHGRNRAWGAGLPMRKVLYEHNTLNGFRFVLVEFAMIALAAIFLAVATFLKGSILWPVGWCGVAVNAGAVCATVVHQMRRGERSQSLAELFSREGRERIRRAHPQLGWHTILIVGAMLVPFLLAVLTIIERPSRTGQA
jgi:hypothetical protein